MHQGNGIVLRAYYVALMVVTDPHPRLRPSLNQGQNGELVGRHHLLGRGRLVAPHAAPRSSSPSCCILEPDCGSRVLLGALPPPQHNAPSQAKGISQGSAVMRRSRRRATWRPLWPTEACAFEVVGGRRSSPCWPAQGQARAVACPRIHTAASDVLTGTQGRAP